MSVLARLTFKWEEGVGKIPKNRPNDYKPQSFTFKFFVLFLRGPKFVWLMEFCGLQTLLWNNFCEWFESCQLFFSKLEYLWEIDHSNNQSTKQQRFLWKSSNCNLTWNMEYGAVAWAVRCVKTNEFLSVCTKNSNCWGLQKPKIKKDF